jgi:hypothetical protein
LNPAFQIRQMFFPFDITIANLSGRRTVPTPSTLPRVIPITKVIQDMRPVTLLRITKLNQLPQLPSFKIRPSRHLSGIDTQRCTIDHHNRSALPPAILRTIRGRALDVPSPFKQVKRRLYGQFVLLTREVRNL